MRARCRGRSEPGPAAPRLRARAAAALFGGCRGIGPLLRTPERRLSRAATRAAAVRAPCVGSLLRFCSALPSQVCHKCGVKGHIATYCQQVMGGGGGGGGGMGGGMGGDKRPFQGGPDMQRITQQRGPGPAPSMLHGGGGMGGGGMGGMMPGGRC